jgi:hypothetical protein
MEIYNGTSTSVIDDSSKLSEVYSEYTVNEANGKRLYSFSKFNSLGTDNLWLRLHKNSKRTDWDDQAINYTADLPKFVKVVQSDTTGEGDSATTTTTTTFSYLHKDESSLFPNNKGINGINEYKRVDEEASETATKKAGKPVTVYKDEVSLVSLSPCTFDIYESEDENAEKKTSVNFAEEIKPGYDKYIGAPYTIKIDFGKLDTVTTSEPTSEPTSFHSFVTTDFEKQNMLQFLNGKIYKFEEVYNEDTDTVTYNVGNKIGYEFSGETVEERCFLVGVSVYCVNRDQKTLIWDSVSGDGSTDFSYTTTVNSDLTVNFGLEYDLLFVESPADGIVQYKTEVYYEGIRIDNPNRI